MPSWHSINSRFENAISESLRFQSLEVTENAGPSLARTGNAIVQRFPYTAVEQRLLRNPERTHPWDSEQSTRAPGEILIKCQDGF